MGIPPRTFLQVLDEIGGHIVQHQGEQGLVGAPLGLEIGRNHAPQATGDEACNQHHGDQQPLRPRLSVGVSKEAAGNGTHANLSLCAYIPEPHTEGQGHTQSRNAQGNGVLHRILEGNRSTQGAGNHGAEDFKRIVSQPQQEHADGAHRQHNGGNAAHRLPQEGYGGALHNVD